MKRGEGRYKQDYNKKFQIEPSNAVGNYVFVDQPLLKTSASVKLASEGYKKLLTRHSVPYFIFNVETKSIRIIQNGIKNIVPFNRVSLVFMKGCTGDT